MSIVIRKIGGDFILDIGHIVLASASPRRRELLAEFGFDFEAVESRADESVPPHFSPARTVKEIALRKALWVKECRKDDGSVVLGADTLVAAGGRLLGKPRDGEDAFRMLSELSGCCHKVYTGVALLCGGRRELFAECTKVFFRTLSPAEIRAYVETGEPMDKAGAYGIQGKGGLFVRRIEGDYYNVLGLPLCKVCELLRTFQARRL